MAKSITKYSIFLSSPNDVDDERYAVEEVINELNRSYAPQNNLFIELLSWQKNSAPGISSISVQSIINSDIGEEYDLFLGIIWNRFGTATTSAESGTEEEFNIAVKKFNTDINSTQILIYFKDSAPTSMKEIEPLQLIKVRDFKDKMKSLNILYFEFNELEDFKNHLRLHIPKRISTLIKKQTNKNKEVIIAEQTVIDDDLGLLDYFDLYVNNLGDCTKILVRISEATEIVAREINMKTDDIGRLQKQPNVKQYLITEHLKLTAKVLNSYSSKLSIDNPLFYNCFEEAIKSGLNFLHLTDDFITDETIIALEETKESIFILRKTIPNAINGTMSFFESIKGLPRIQVDFNKAKKELMSKLEELINKLQKTEELTEEFSNEISAKIDKLKLIKSNKCSE